MSAIIDTLVATGPPDEHSLVALAEQHGWPPVAGEHVTFMFWGEADAVNVRHWIHGLPGVLPLRRVGLSPLWFVELKLPAQSRVEYKLEVVRGGHSEWIIDPRNPHRAYDPFGANSVCYGPGYRAPTWTQPNATSRKGHIETIEITSEAFGETRQVPVYLPARYRKSNRYPLLIAHDGSDYLRYSSFQVVLDNLIDRLEIPAMVVALSNPGDRLREYADDPRHARHLVTELMVALEARYPLLSGPHNRGLLGASFGAVAALSTAWHYPGYFGRLLLQSGSFAFTDIGHHKRSPEFDPVVTFINRLRQAPGKPAERVFMSCGMYESLIYENRSMLPVLQQAGIDVRLVEAPDGHNWENWRDRLREGLSWLFPGPLWMTYE
ncbi:MAG TPA: enterochelin esterase [Sorangium sp.]|nr:enterochelin esterase [Sorangium sp.]